MHPIKQNGLLLAVQFGVNDIKAGLNFFTDEKDFIQVGGWRYDKDKILQAHKHNFVERKVTRTQEFVFVIHGNMKVTLYDEDERFVEEVILTASEGMILLAGCHGYHILSDDTIVLEIKNGPYPGAEVDRKRI